jgi:membrane-associated protein
MTYRRFATFNVVGAAGWVASMTLTGYFLGQVVGTEVLEKKIHLVVAVVIFLSLLPGMIAVLRAKLQGPRSAPAAVAE